MKGLALCRAYYETFGAPMIHEQFPDFEERIAVALTGSGSECYGYDDEISRDHDFEPGFCLFLPGEEIIDRRSAFLLERAYAKLPREFQGFSRQSISPVGGNRHGVFRLADFFRDKIGCLPEDLTPAAWLRLPDYALAEAVNGAVFRDDTGLLTSQRAILQAMPEDIRRKRLAAHLLLMGQSGQYNYRRCLSHGETGAAQLAVAEFVRHAMAATFLLYRRYMPYYKWAFRALRELRENPDLQAGNLSDGEEPAHSLGAQSPELQAGSLPDGEELARSLEWLLSTGNEAAQAEEKIFAIEGIASSLIDALQAQNLTEAVCGDLEKHAYSVNDGIRDSEIRNWHILSAE